MPPPHVEPHRSAAAQRIVDAAMGLFADHGYAATSVAQIEAAAGLTPRASGMYRHFRSKRAVLEAGLGDRVAALQALHAIDPADPGGSPGDDVPLHDWLDLMVRVGVAQLREQRDLIRILHRDLGELPELLESMKEHLIRAGYRDFAARLRRGQGAGAIDAELDVDAAAAVAIGAVVNHGVFLAMLDEPPGGIEEERFARTWVRMVERAVAP